MENLEEQIKLLVELQELDTRIFRLESEIESIPVRIAEAEDNFKNKSSELKKLEDALKTLQLKRKEKEGDLESKEGTIKKYQTQMYQVKTNKEYTALQEEIERAKADNSLIEEDIIRILDEADAESKKIQKEKEFLKAEEANLSEEKKILTAEADKFKTEVEGLKKQRNGLAERIDKKILPKYERIVKSKGGLAVARVINDACQGCHRVMPPQVINEIRMKKDLVFCESCARILYIEE
jgi:uncharacterized protein